MRRRKPSPESKARAERIARSLAGMLEDVPAVPAPTSALGSSSSIPLHAHAGLTSRLPEAPKYGAIDCPRCGAAMQTVGANHGVELDQCRECGAIWLDVGELEALLADKQRTDTLSAPPTMAQVRARMAAVVPAEAGVKYRECPRCQQIMRRRNFGTISGIVIDECVVHGVLLDAGELPALEEFVALGGPALGEHVRREQNLRNMAPSPGLPVQPEAAMGSYRRRGDPDRSIADWLWDRIFDR